MRLDSAAQGGLTANQVHVLNLINLINLFELNTIELATTMTGFRSRQPSPKILLAR